MKEKRLRVCDKKHNEHCIHTHLKKVCDFNIQNSKNIQILIGV